MSMNAFYLYRIFVNNCLHCQDMKGAKRHNIPHHTSRKLSRNNDNNLSLIRFVNCRCMYVCMYVSSFFTSISIQYKKVKCATRLSGHNKIDGAHPQSTFAQVYDKRKTCKERGKAYIRVYVLYA